MPQCILKQENALDFDGKVPIKFRKCAHNYQACNSRGFMGDLGSLFVPLENWKFLLEKPLLCFLVPALWPLPQVFLWNMLNFESPSLLFAYSPSQNQQVKNQWVLFKIHDCLRTYDSQDSCGKAPGLQIGNVQNVIPWLDLTGVAPHAHKQAVCLVCHCFLKVLRRAGAEWSSYVLPRESTSELTFQCLKSLRQLHRFSVVKPR